MPNSNTRRYHETMRRGLLKAAKNGTLPSGWIQDRGVVSLGDFWVRLKKELLSKPRNQAKIECMLDELRASGLQDAEAADDDLLSAGIGELDEEDEEEESSEQRRQAANDEAEVEMKGQSDMDDNDSDDDVFIRWPRRRQRPSTRHSVKEEL